MNRETNSLLLKSNRVLGTRLVEAELQNLEQIDEANQRFVQHARNKDLALASLLRVLVYETQSLDEQKYVDYCLSRGNVGGVYLQGYQMDETLYQEAGLEICQATWSCPFDCVNDEYFVATTYFLSDISKQYWNDKFPGKVHWFITTLSDMENTFERLSQAFDASQNTET